MTKKKNRRPEGLSPVMAPKVNPLSAAAPVAPIEPTVQEDPAAEEKLPGQPNPSEFDPELEELKEEELEDEDELGSDEEPEELKPEPSESVNHLGNPKAPAFNPQDSSKGFYQGIDPSTGERVYSK